MSVEQADIIDGIKDKIQSVRLRLREQQEENQQLKKQNEDLQQLVEEKQSVIDELEHKNQQLALVKSMMADGEESRDAKIQINKIVREIDKCIALLNR